MPGLLLSVRFLEGRYHGGGEWPPSPARLFQALIAGAAHGADLSETATAGLQWLECLEAPVITAPSAYAGQSFKTFVPNNDLDAVGGDPGRVSEIRAAKIIRPHHFDVEIPLLYGWTFRENAESARHARTVCEIADRLYQLGRGVDMAWAYGEIVAETQTETRPNDLVLWRPSKGSGGTTVSCPRPGSLASLRKRFAAMRMRFKVVGKGRKASRLFSQAPKPSFEQVAYNSQSEFLLFEMRNEDAFAPEPLEHVVALTEKIRDLAAERLRASSWRRENSKRDDWIERVFIGSRDSTEADKAQRVRITPLPSIGHVHVDHSIRRVLVTVPPNCPISQNDIEWSFSGLTIASDQNTGEVLQELVRADDDSMFVHYGIEASRNYRLWRSVTPAALPERAARRRIDPRRVREEAKGGTARLKEHAAAEHAVRQALRHAGVATPVCSVRMQREPFEAKGERAESFAPGTRFAKERLWHVEIGFAEPTAGPLLLGDGRYLGLGLMAPVRRADGMYAFGITDGLTNACDHNEIARALRRAVMARAQAFIGARETLPVFFTGHAANGAPARSGTHDHLAFASDLPRKRLLVLAPHILARRQPLKIEQKALQILEKALEGFQELRAGAAGKLTLVACPPDMTYDPLFASAHVWETLTPYSATRHAKLSDAAAALKSDIRDECERAGLPRPEIEIFETFGRPGLGLFGRARLRFRVAVAGPILLGRDRHFGGGLFARVA